MVATDSRFDRSIRKIPHRTALRAGAIEASLLLPDRLVGIRLGAMSAGGDYAVVEPLFEAWVDRDQRVVVEGSHVRLAALDRLFGRGTARIDLNALSAWSIRVDGDLHGTQADLGAVAVRALEVRGSVIDSALTIGSPAGLSRLSFGAVRGLSIAHAADVPVRVLIRGEVVETSPTFAAAPSRLEIVIAGAAERLTITAY